MTMGSAQNGQRAKVATGGTCVVNGAAGYFPENARAMTERPCRVRIYH